MSDSTTQKSDSQNETTQDLATQALEEAQESDQFAETLGSLEHVIERNANQLEEIKQQIKERREMMKNYMENDVQLQEADEQLTTFKQEVQARKLKLQEEPQMVDLKIKMRELKERKKEIEETLNNHLLNHYQLTNSTSFDTSDGDQWEYKVQARVKSKPRH